MRDLSTLREAVHAVRVHGFEQLPATLVDEILSIEADLDEDRLLARDRVSSALNSYLTNTDTP